MDGWQFGLARQQGLAMVVIWGNKHPLICGIRKEGQGNIGNFNKSYLVHPPGTD